MQRYRTLLIFFFSFFHQQPVSLFASWHSSLDGLGFTKADCNVLCFFRAQAANTYGTIPRHCPQKSTTNHACTAKPSCLIRSPNA